MVQKFYNYMIYTKLLYVSYLFILFYIIPSIHFNPDLNDTNLIISIKLEYVSERLISLTK
jgi:hypothetical protein